MHYTLLYIIQHYSCKGCLCFVRLAHVNPRGRSLEFILGETCTWNDIHVALKCVGLTSRILCHLTPPCGNKKEQHVLRHLRWDVFKGEVFLCFSILNMHSCRNRWGFFSKRGTTWLLHSAFRLMRWVNFKPLYVNFQLCIWFNFLFVLRFMSVLWKRWIGPRWYLMKSMELILWAGVTPSSLVRVLVLSTSKYKESLSHTTYREGAAPAPNHQGEERDSDPEELRSAIKTTLTQWNPIRSGVMDACLLRSVRS